MSLMGHLLQLGSLGRLKSLLVYDIMVRDPGWTYAANSAIEDTAVTWFANLDSVAIVKQTVEKVARYKYYT